MTEDEEAAERKIVADAVTRLGDHFDTVQIFVTRHVSGEDGGTIRFNDGAGNWFARFGQVHEYVIREEETSRINARKQNE